MGDQFKIVRCVRCEAIFVRIRTAVCTHCLDAEEEDFHRIRDVLHEHKHLNVVAVAELAEVTEACVLRMLGEGLIVNEQVSHDVKCGQCGAPAISTSQRLCARCLANLDRKFVTEISEARQRMIEAPASASVHVMLNRKRKKSIDSNEL